MIKQRWTHWMARAIASVSLLAVPAMVWAAEEAAAEGHGGDGLLGALGIEPKTVLVQLLAFLGLLFLLRKFLWGPILNLLDTRQQEVATYYAEAEQARESAETARRDYEARLARAEEESRERINAALQQAAAMKDEIISAARQESDRIVTSGHETVRQETEKALVTLRDEVAHLAVGAAGRIIRRNLDEETHRGLVEEFIANAGNGRTS